MARTHSTRTPSLQSVREWTYVGARCMHMERHSTAPILPSYWRTSWVRLPPAAHHHTTLWHALTSTTTFGTHHRTQVPPRPLPPPPPLPVAAGQPRLGRRRVCKLRARGSGSQKGLGHGGPGGRAATVRVHMLLDIQKGARFAFQHSTNRCHGPCVGVSCPCI